MKWHVNIFLIQNNYFLLPHFIGINQIIKKKILEYYEHFLTLEL